MEGYKIEYEYIVGYNCFGGRHSETVSTKVYLKDEEVEALLAHLAKYELSKLIDLEEDDIDLPMFAAEQVNLQEAFPKIYDKILDANLDALWRAKVETDHDNNAILPYGIVKRALLAERKTQVFYHGTGACFSTFDLAHALEGDGKCKFGFGVYLTSEYKSALHYANVNPDWRDHYVYTVEVPEITDENALYFHRQVPASIVGKIEELIGESIPEKDAATGKDFRKRLASILYKRLAKDAKAEGREKPMAIEGEKAASSILLKAGIEYIVWPYNWRQPDDLKKINIAVLDPQKINILKRRWVC